MGLRLSSLERVDERCESASLELVDESLGQVSGRQSDQDQVWPPYPHYVPLLVGQDQPLPCYRCPPGVRSGTWFNGSCRAHFMPSVLIPSSATIVRRFKTLPRMEYASMVSDSKGDLIPP